MRFADLPEEKQEEVIQRYYDLFAGRLDTYAIRMEFEDSDTIYVPSTYDGDSKYLKAKIPRIVKDIGTDEFGPEAIRAHITGQYHLGVYPLTEQSTVRFFVLDFDKKKEDDPEPYPAAISQALILSKEAGLKVYIERSQGGKGFHVWGFLDGEMDAGKLRHALSPLIERVETYDRMFPNQGKVNALKPLGNLIALPFSGPRMALGNTCFVVRDAAGEPEAIEDQWAFLDSIECNPVELLEKLYEEAGEYVPESEGRARDVDLEALPDWWKVTHERFGCEWIRWCYENPYLVNEPLWHSLASQFAQLDNGRELFHEWSRQDETRYDPRHTDRKFDQALRENKPHTCETIRERGGDCTCDYRFDKLVKHPYDLAKVPFKTLVETIGSEDADDFVMTADVGFSEVFDWAEKVEADPTLGRGYPYGIVELDEATGMRDSDLIVIAARPGRGKSAIMATIVDNTAVQGIPNYVFSAEMSRTQFFRRQISTRSGVNNTRLVTGQLTRSDWEKLRETKEFVQDIENYPVYVDDLSRSTTRIFEVASQLVMKHGKGIIWIDYLQLLQRKPKESPYEAVSRIASDLALLAKSLGVPVVALTQLNRTADDASEEGDTYDSWLQGSGRIEEASSVIIFILGNKGPGVVERILVLHKERHRGAGIRVHTEFNQPLMRFADPGTWNTEAPKRRRRSEAPEVAQSVDESLHAMRGVINKYTADLDGRHHLAGI